MITMNDAALARTLTAALAICAAQGNALVSDVAEVTGDSATACLAALAALARRGDLVARPGNSFARPLVRRSRLPGDSWPTDLRLPVSALMVAR